MDMSCLIFEECLHAASVLDWRFEVEKNFIFVSNLGETSIVESEDILHALEASGLPMGLGFPCVILGEQPPVCYLTR